MQVFILISICGYITGMFNPIMEIDAMQYASMSRELLRGDNLLHFFDNGQPYLDKPPLIFWITSLFFKIFGTSDFIYRLPSVLFSVLTIYSVYRFAILFYSKQTALTAAVILSSCEAFFIMNSDVRTDMYMIAPMMLAFWQISFYLKSGKLYSLLVGSIAIGFSMMGKGPLGIIILLSVFGFEMAVKRRLSNIIDINILLGIVVIILCLFPMSYGLYTQFGSKGIQFFYWTQSFGRITGDSSWTNQTGPFYLFNVFLYAFLPWTFLFLWAFYKKTKGLIFRKTLFLDNELISYFGFLLSMVMLSLSNYKLPHYIYCAIPFAAIITAKGIEDLMQKKRLYICFYIIQFIIGILLVSFVFGISFYAFPFRNYYLLFPIFIFLFLVSYFHIRTHDEFIKFFIPSISAVIIANYWLNLFFMNHLLAYQAPSEAANFLKKNNYDFIQLYFYKESEKAKSRSFNFYLDREIIYIDGEFPIRKTEKNIIVYTGQKGYDILMNLNPRPKLLSDFSHFRVSKINNKFLDKKRRLSVLKKKYLLMFTPT